jgi:hypothetical protein
MCLHHHFSRIAYYTAGVCRNGAVLFSDRRLQDTREKDNDVGLIEYADLALTGPVEEFLNYRWDWNDLWAFASADVLCKVLWITDRTFLLVGTAPAHFHSRDFQYKFLSVASSTTRTGGQAQTMALFDDRYPYSAVSTGACSIFWRATVTSNSARLFTVLRDTRK